jgi:hypothetical protein
MVDIEIEEELVSIVDEKSGLDLTLKGRVPREWLLVALAVVLAAFGLSDLSPLG